MPSSRGRGAERSDNPYLRLRFIYCSPFHLVTLATFDRSSINHHLSEDRYQMQAITRLVRHPAKVVQGCFSLFIYTGITC